MQDPEESAELKVYDLTEAEASLAPKRVLMLEDEDEFSAIVKDLLQSQGFSVTCVRTGVEGLKCIMAGNFDVIICDLLMPALPGDMFYLAVERIKPQLCKRFIFISGHRANPRWETFIQKIDGLILWKPFPMKDLLAAITKVLAS